MEKGLLVDRAQALENAFFYKVDQDLRRKLHEKIEAERRYKELAEATGIKDDAVLNELVELKLSAETVLALSLVPLVWVAWADGSIADEERKAVLQAAKSVGFDQGAASYELLERWLVGKPGDKFLTAWKDYTTALGRTISSNARDSLRRELLGRARAVAEAAGGILGVHKISSAEEAVLADLERGFSEIVASQGDD